MSAANLELDVSAAARSMGAARPASAHAEVAVPAGEVARAIDAKVARALAREARGPRGGRGSLLRAALAHGVLVLTSVVVLLPVLMVVRKAFTPGQEFS